MSIFKKKQQDDNPRRRKLDDTNEPSLINNRLGYSNSFRRNRTITGSTSDGVDITNTKLQHLESDRQTAHNLNRQRRKIFVLFFISILAVLSIWLLVSNLIAGVRVVVSESSISTPVNSSKYEKIIQNYLNINPASRLSIFLNQDDLTDYVSSKLNEVKKVSYMGMDKVGVTKFVISLRQPIASWQLGEKRYYVDSDGVAFGVNNYAQPSLQVVDNSGVSVSPTTSVASKRFLSFVGRIVSLSKGYGYTITEVIIPVDTTRQLEIVVKEGNYRVKLTVDRPAGEQVEDMAKAIAYFNNRNMLPKYVDVRVSGRAFYLN